ncbi:MAG: acylphosphatase [Candidatus Margulisbacteria bacterium]|nr:acylphosphatase [Candidatus Margulisiibacteriota bacterium]MBU1617635.1 acylphosphatase [Candidatus Margulisiibacteriota bacterium]MBU1866928.1 acylphosphatase [Candidatus Margulisiibacteriota bacterium]
MMKRAHVVYSGRVQGVGFRYTAVDQAGKFPVVGWVKNLPGEKVELVVEGEEEAIAQYTSALSRIFKRRIQKEEFYWEPATGEFTGFQIDY